MRASLWLLLALGTAAGAQPTPETALELARRDFDAGRFEAAAARLREAQGTAPSYEGWLALGLACGRLQRFEEARAAFDAALALDARRAEAWLERGGLAFLERDYVRAARDLEQALLRTPGDDYTRDLLGSSLHLAGQGDDALRVFNRAGQPLLGKLTLAGLVSTRERVVRRELALAEGRVLALGELRRSRLRLAQLGIFERVTLRATPLGEGRADLEAAFVERHGFYATRAEFVASSAILAAQGRARLRYTNLGGAAVNLGGELRWQARRPQASLYAELARPLGLPATLRVQGLRGRQAYDVGGEVTARTRGVDVIVRHVAAPRTVLQLDLRARDRAFTRPRPDAPPGLVFGPELAIEQRLLEAPRVELDAGLRLFHALTGLRAGVSALAEVNSANALERGAPAPRPPAPDAALGPEASELLVRRVASGRRYARAVATVEGRVFLAGRDGTALERSLVAFRLRAGYSGAATPLDDLFAPGASPEMELPLRAHRQLADGAIGATPLGRALLLANVEWRQRLWSSAALQAGIVVFYDGARIGARAPAAPETLHDVGLGLRLALRGAATLRVDYARSLVERRRGFSLGLGQVF